MTCPINSTSQPRHSGWKLQKNTGDFSRRPKRELTFLSLTFPFVRLSCIATEVPEIVSDIEAKLLNDVRAIREIVAQQGRLSVDVFGLDETSDLYSAGLTSLATVGIMLALEDRFDIEFPESMLSRKTFNSVASISEAVAQLAT